MKNLRKIKSLFYSFQANVSMNKLKFEFDITKEWGLWPDRNLNPLTRNPRKYFSQSDEDGITEKILMRFGTPLPGCVIEFGVGDGSENNSLALIAKGWRSYWIGGQDLIFDFPKSCKHYFKKVFVNLDNISEIVDDAILRLDTTESLVDIVSMDLDGNDYHFAKLLLDSGLSPRLWIIEYNAKFPPGSTWVMPYNSTHTWSSDDYFGASYSSFIELFSNHGYFPVACSVQGANIFFVRESDRNKFLDVTIEVDKLYQPPFYYLISKWGHVVAAETIENIFAEQK